VTPPTPEELAAERERLTAGLAELRERYLGDVAQAAQAAGEAGRRLDEAVAAARAAGASWADIGKRAGMARQSAQQRWGNR
jgi:hypothetical protein